MNSKTKKSRFILCLVIFGGVVLANGFAADPKNFVVPGRKSVMLIGRLVVRENLDVPFYSKSFNIDPSLPHTYTMGILYEQYKKLGLIEKRQYTYNNGDFFFRTVELDKDRLTGLMTIQFDLWSSPKTNIALPLSVACKVPVGVQYLYIGSFYYNFDNKNFALNVTHVDEFDQAQELLKTLIPDAEIQRAILIHEDDKPNTDAEKGKKK